MKTLSKLNMLLSEISRRSKCSRGFLKDPETYGTKYISYKLDHH